MNKSATIILRVSADLKAELKAMADKKELPLSAFIRLLLVESTNNDNNDLQTIPTNQNPPSR